MSNELKDTDGLPPGYKLAQDDDGDWMLIPPPGVVVFSAPGEPRLLTAETRQDAVAESLVIIGEV